MNGVQFVHDGDEWRMPAMRHLAANLTQRRVYRINDIELNVKMLEHMAN